MAEPWYRDGLSFECTMCGNCCTGTPGYVWVTPDELVALAAKLGQSVAEVRAMHTRTERDRVTLRELDNGDCVFYRAGVGCTVYEARPVQCRTWPFWDSTVGTRRAWERTQRDCPGAGQGPLITSEEITRRMRTIKL